MSEAAVPWREVEAQLRPFVARRVDAPDVDDVLQDVLLRVHRGLPGLADEERLGGWMYAIARNAITEHGRSRARHPVAEPREAESPDPGPGEGDEDDRLASRLLAACLSSFVARLPSPYREAVTLVELEGMTAREASAMCGVSVSGMKSRVQRGRRQLRAMLEQCCAIELDARGKVTAAAPKRTAPCACSPPRRA